MSGRLSEATEEQVQEMLRLLGTYEFPLSAILYYTRWALGTEVRPLSPASMIRHMQIILAAGGELAEEP